MLDSVEAVLALPEPPAELLLIDQTESHTAETDQRLAELEQRPGFRRLCPAQPSITRAMNLALREAQTSHVLFLDDDILPVSDLAAIHRKAHENQPELWATVGQVIQPWQESEAITPPREFQGLKEDFDFPFHSSLDADVRNVMAGNLCVHRERALSVGGFDENFQGSAFRFETEFARRIVRAGGTIRFLGGAGIRHLRVSAGGTRSQGSHLTSASPHHGIGDHYYAFLHGGTAEAWWYAVRRVIREVSTRFHLTHPWWIPVKLTGEIRALLGGLRLAAQTGRQQPESN